MADILSILLEAVLAPRRGSSFPRFVAPAPSPLPERESIYPQLAHVPIAVTPETPLERGQDTQCQVCGSQLEGDLVACCCCATLHHRDCWDYNRGCSTYGCRRRAA